MGGTLFDPVWRGAEHSYVLKTGILRILLKRGDSGNVINKHRSSHAHPTLDKILESGDRNNRCVPAKPSEQAGEKHYRKGKIKYFFHGVITPSFFPIVSLFPPTMIVFSQLLIAFSLA